MGVEVLGEARRAVLLAGELVGEVMAIGDGAQGVDHRRGAVGGVVRVVLTDAGDLLGHFS
jgi:hypothetical protein